MTRGEERSMSPGSHVTFRKGETTGRATVLSFAGRLRQEGVHLRRMGIDTVQINVGKLCNQACVHCHVDAGPKRTLISVGWDGFLYDCDFNQMRDLRLGSHKPLRLGEWPAPTLVQFLAQGDIRVDSHCYGCTAGAGSSCGGALTP